MASMMDDLLGQLGGGQLDQLAGMLGTDTNQVQGAIGTALPALLEGLMRNASTPEGAGSLHKALQEDHDGSLLDLGDLLGGVDKGDGEKILGHIFGDSQPAAEQTLANRAGSSPGLLRQLLPILAPMVLAWLGRKQRQGGLDSGGLSDVLGTERNEAAKGMPDLGDLLGSVLGGGGGLGEMLGQATGGGGGGMGEVLDQMSRGQDAARSGGGGLLGMLKRILSGGR